MISEIVGVELVREKVDIHTSALYPLTFSASIRVNTRITRSHYAEKVDYHA